MQGIGFTDEVDHADIDRIMDAARRHCAELKPFLVTIGPTRVDPESLHLPVGPVTPLATVSTVSLIDLNRNRKTYEWAEVATVPSGRP